MGTVFVGKRKTLLNISSFALFFGYRFKFHNKLKISSASKHSIGPVDRSGLSHPWGPKGDLRQARSLPSFLWSRLVNRLHYLHRDVLLLPRFPRRPRRLYNHRLCRPRLDRQEINPKRQC